MANEGGSASEGPTAGQMKDGDGETGTDQRGAGAVGSARENDVENPFRDPGDDNSERGRGLKLENGGRVVNGER
jgi:hypothetical protein